MKLQEKPFPISRRIAGESQIGSGHYQEPSGLSASGAAGRWSRAAFLRAVGKAALGCGAGLGVLAFSCQARAGGLYQDGTTSQQTTDFAIPYVSSALSFRISVPGVGTGRRDASAAFLNSRYAVTAAHNVTDLLQYNPTYAVADGTNFLTNRGNIMVVTDVTFHPTLDLAILKFAAPFQPTTNKVIGTANVGDTAYSAGFGQWGTPSTRTPKLN